MSPPHEPAVGTDGVIENIAALAISDATEPANEGAEVLSLSSVTSVTSVASALSDGLARPRSASLGVPARPNSTPRHRPRSNPRTRTPMRHPSPLMVTGGATEASGARDVNASSMNEARTANNENVSDGVQGVSNESMISNIFHTRRLRSRSIPEEKEEDVELAADGVSNIDAHNGPTSNGTNVEGARAAPAHSAPAAGHLFARAATNMTSARSNRATNPTRPRFPGLSDKQRPSHRKLRRWNNDRFVGTASEQLHVQLESEAGATDQYFREFIMPNYPCNYQSEFARLSVDETKSGKGVRDRFLRGEVAHRGKSDEYATKDMGQCVVAKFRKLGISLQKMTGMSENDVRDEMGNKLFAKLSPRIQSVVSRACALDSDDPSSAVEVIAAFESYLVSLALAGSKKDVGSLGYPPQQPPSVYDVLDEVLSSPPHIVLRGHRRGSFHGSKHSHAVLVPAVHFYFPAEDATAGSGNGRSSAFHRILLYAVCQFHGLEASSSVHAPRRKNGSTRGNNGQGCLKVVTVQRGILLAPTLKLLDYVDDSS